MSAENMNDSIEFGLYLENLKSGKYKPKTWDAKVKKKNCDAKGATIKTKLIQFHGESTYFGTWRMKHNKINGRNPFVRDDKLFDYNSEALITPIQPSFNKNHAMKVQPNITTGLKSELVGSISSKWLEADERSFRPSDGDISNEKIQQSILNGIEDILVLPDQKQIQVKKIQQGMKKIEPGIKTEHVSIRKPKSGNYGKRVNDGKFSENLGNSVSDKNSVENLRSRVSDKNGTGNSVENLGNRVSDKQVRENSVENLSSRVSDKKATENLVEKLDNRVSDKKATGNSVENLGNRVSDKKATGNSFKLVNEEKDGRETAKRKVTLAKFVDIEKGLDISAKRVNDEKRLKISAECVNDVKAEPVKNSTPVWFYQGDNENAPHDAIARLNSSNSILKQSGLAFNTPKLQASRKSLQYKKKSITPIDSVTRKEVTTFSISKKRKLIVDEENQINLDQFKSQMKNTEDTLMTLDLAPPTKRTMAFLKHGKATDLIALPGRKSLSSKLKNSCFVFAEHNIDSFFEFEDQNKIKHEKEKQSDTAKVNTEVSGKLCEFSNEKENTIEVHTDNYVPEDVAQDHKQNDNDHNLATVNTEGSGKLCEFSNEKENTIEVHTDNYLPEDVAQDHKQNDNVHNLVNNNNVTVDCWIELTERSVDNVSQSNLANTEGSDKLCEFSIEQKDIIEVRIRDYNTLQPGEFLNDIVIDFYSKYLFANKLHPIHKDSVHIFSTLFYKRLIQSPKADAKNVSDFEKDTSLNIFEKQHLRVAGWTKDTDLFDKELIIVPVCKASHWYLILVRKPYLIKNQVQLGNRPEEENPSIILLDSLGRRHPFAINNIRQYLSTEWEKRKKDETSASIKSCPKNFPCVYPKKPEQLNGYDCGVFLLHYMEKVFENIEGFLSPILPDLSKWFAIEEIKEKRQNIATIIKRLGHQQYPNREIIYPQILLKPKLKVEITKSVRDVKDANENLQSDTSVTKKNIQREGFGGQARGGGGADGGRGSPGRGGFRGGSHDGGEEKAGGGARRGGGVFGGQGRGAGAFGGQQRRRAMGGGGGGGGGSPARAGFEGGGCDGGCEGGRGGGEFRAPRGGGEFRAPRGGGVFGGQRRGAGAFGGPPLTGYSHLATPLVNFGHATSRTNSNLPIPPTNDTLQPRQFSVPNQGRMDTAANGTRSMINNTEEGFDAKSTSQLTELNTFGDDLKTADDREDLEIDDDQDFSEDSSREETKNQKSKFQCEKCNCRFGALNKLEMHFHHKHVPIQCHECDKLILRDKMSRHLNTHTKEYSFPCPICGKVFNRKDNLRTHCQLHVS